MNTKDVFDILGIDSREDSYTDLVKFLFDNWDDFRVRFCRLFAGVEADDFVLESRRVFGVAKAHQSIRAKISPDLILFSSSQNIVALIENKIFSGEGHRQTCEYIKNENVIKEALGLPQDAIFSSHKFVTLDGDIPSSEKFHPLKWADLVIECCKGYDSIVDMRMKVLVKDLHTRATEYRNFPSPKDNESFADFLKNKRHWITPYRLNRQFMSFAMKNLENFCDYTFHASRSINRAGVQYLYYFYKKHWVSGHLNDEVSPNFHIHIETNWLEGADEVKIAVHYETNPYITQKELSQKSDGFKQSYFQLRNAFKGRFHQEIRSTAWTARNTALAIADCKVDANISFAEFKKQLKERIEAIAVAIENTVALAHTELQDEKIQ